MNDGEAASNSSPYYNYIPDAAPPTTGKAATNAELATYAHLEDFKNEPVIIVIASY